MQVGWLRNPHYPDVIFSKQVSTQTDADDIINELRHYTESIKE